MGIGDNNDSNNDNDTPIVDINSKVNKNASPLVYAVRGDGLYGTENAQIVKLLLDCDKTDVDVKVEDECNCTVIACNRTNDKILI